MRRRQDLVEQGVVEIRSDDYVFLRDQLFNSPSTAGAVVLGGSINGRIAWKTATGRTFQQLEDEALSRLRTPEPLPGLRPPGSRVTVRSASG